MNKDYPPLPSEIGRALDRIEGGAITWDPVLLRFLRARCFENLEGRAQFRHRRQLYRCETQSALIHELLYPKTDVLGRGLLEPMVDLRSRRMQFTECGSAEPGETDAGLAFRARCKTYLASWQVGTIRSLTVEVRACARLLLEQAGLLPPARDPEREWACAWLDLAHEAAFQPTVLTRRDQTARAQMKRRAKRDLETRRKKMKLSQTDEPAVLTDPDLLWHAGPALELALIAPFWVLMNQGMVDEETLRGPPRDWVRNLIVCSWQLLPPFWLRSRETRYEFRLGTERVPARVRFLFGPSLLEGSFDFERTRPMCVAQPSQPATFEPAWLFGSGATSCPFGPAAIERMGILFEEILASCRPEIVPGGCGWVAWEDHFPEALTESLPFHLCPPRYGR
ncbi:MAG: hypothetical protein ACYCS1_01395 [Gammaproteobacteria bacterium]